MEQEGPPVASTEASALEAGITDWIDITRFLEQQEREKKGEEHLWKLPHEALRSRAVTAVDFGMQQELIYLLHDFDELCAASRASVCRTLLEEARKVLEELTTKRDNIMMVNSFRLERELLAEKEAEREAREKTPPPKLPAIQTLVFETTPSLSEEALRKILDWTVDTTGDLREKHNVTLDPIMGNELGDENEEVVVLQCCNEAFKCIFNKSTVLKAFESDHRCPLCGHSYAIDGPQPSGAMEISYNAHTCCEGHEPFGTIVIHYSFPPGIQTERMHKPGDPYDLDSRTVYLPADETGARCAQWLIAAFKQGKLFKVGLSSTRDCVGVVWNGIHQKTRTNGGEANHGWPDETTKDHSGHLDRLISECKKANVSLTEQ